MVIQENIDKVIESIVKVLMVKNARYGNSALKPIGIFYKGDSTSSIRIRLDDKINRVKNSNELRKNDIFDILGYLILFLLSIETETQEKSFEERVNDVVGVVREYIDKQVKWKCIFKKDMVFDGVNKDVLLYNMDFIVTNEITGMGDEQEYNAVVRLIVDIILYFAVTDVTDFSDLID